MEVIVKGNLNKNIIKFNTNIDPNNYKLKKNTNNVYMYSSNDNEPNENVEIILKRKHKPSKAKGSNVFIYSHDENDRNNEDIVIIEGVKTKVVNGNKVINTWKSDDNDEEIIIDLKKENNI